MITKLIRPLNVVCYANLLLISLDLVFYEVTADDMDTTAGAQCLYNVDDGQSFGRSLSSGATAI
jgi:hypothetical protein